MERYNCWFILFQEKAESALRAHSSSVRVSESTEKIAADNLPKNKNTQAFIKEEVLTSIHNVSITFFPFRPRKPLSYNELNLLLHFFFRVFSHALPSSSLLFC